MLCTAGQIQRRFDTISAAAGQIALKFTLYVHAAIFLRRRCNRILLGPVIRVARLGNQPKAEKRATYCIDLLQFGVCRGPRATGLCILDSRGLPGARWSAACSTSHRTESDIRLIDDPVPFSFSRRFQIAAV